MSLLTLLEVAVVRLIDSFQRCSPFRGDPNLLTREWKDRVAMWRRGMIASDFKVTSRR